MTLPSTKIRIKQAAARLYSERGFEGTTMATIAEEVGIKPPSIYNYFSNKEQLFLEMYKELLEEHYQQLIRILEEVEGKSAKEKIYQILYGVANYHLDKPDKTKLATRLMLFPPISLQQNVSEYFLRIEQYERLILRDLFEKGIKNLEIKKLPLEEMVTHFLCIMDGLFLELQYYHKQQFLEKVAIIWNQYWCGIGLDGESEMNQLSEG